MVKQITFILLLLSSYYSFSQLSDKDETLLRRELYLLINTLRTDLGKAPLQLNDTLQKAAENHSDYMVKNNILSHTQRRSKYATPKDRVSAFSGDNFDVVGENILYSSPQTFPLNKNKIKALANEMFKSWKNSPGHYANMINTEYTHGDFGFTVDVKKQIVYATHVLGKKGYTVPDQLSANAFGIKKAPEDCDKEFESYSNLIMNLGNCLSIEGDEVILYYHNKEQFKKIFPNENDGIAIDLISQSQVACGSPNTLDANPIYDGILLRPYYSDQLLSNNRAKGDHRLITKVGDIPAGLQTYELSPSLVLIKDGKACKYAVPVKISRDSYPLQWIEPFSNDIPSTQLLQEGIVRSEVVPYHFTTNKTYSSNHPDLPEHTESIHSVKINTYSSVEGDTPHNEKLHTSRADYIQKHLNTHLKIPSDALTIETRENWEEMNFQLNYFERDDLALLTKDSLKSFLKTRDNTLPWDSLFFSQRKSVAVINYQGSFSDYTALGTIGELNLRTAVASENVLLANKALYHMYNSMEYNPAILFEDPIQEFIIRHPATVTNYAALLSYNYDLDPPAVTRFIHRWIGRSEELDDQARSNLLHLHSLISMHLIDNWDISAKRLANVIHPKKIEAFIPDKIQDDLILNLHLAFIQYFSQINDQVNISKSFYFISDYFKLRSISPEDDVRLALFFNNWSMYKMAIDHLTPRFKNNTLSTDGLFILAENLFLSNATAIENELLVDVNSKALSADKERWCEWLFNDFQIQRNSKIKQLYCESCE